MVGDRKKVLLKQTVNTFHAVFFAHHDAYNELQVKLQEFAEQQGVSDVGRDRLQLVTEELLVNVIEHAYAGAKQGEIEVQALFSGNTIEIVIQDSGNPYNPLESPAVDISVPLDARKVGGLGLHLVKLHVESMEYQRLGEQNILKVCLLTGD